MPIHKDDVSLRHLTGGDFFPKKESLDLVGIEGRNAIEAQAIQLRGLVTIDLICHAATDGW